MITEEEYVKWLHRCTSREATFVNVYLKTLDAWKAFQEAGYSHKAARAGKCKVFHRLLPYIQYRLQKYDMVLSKNFIVSNWLNILADGDMTAKQNALRELSKIFGYSNDVQVNVENNIQSPPVVIKFKEDGSAPQS